MTPVNAFPIIKSIKHDLKTVVQGYKDPGVKISELDNVESLVSIMNIEPRKNTTILTSKCTRVLGE